MSSLLIVRHGPGRGRGPNAGAPLLEYLRTARPVSWREVRVWRTGSHPPSLEGVRAVLFWLADPLRELYPDCFGEAVAIAQEARHLGLRLINPPEALSNTIKSVQADRWKAAGVATAAAFPFKDPAEFAVRLDAAPFPVIVRPDWLHSQAATHYCRTPSEAVRLAQQGDLVFPGVLLPLIDTRAGYSRAAPGTVWARFFHKKRCFVFGNRVIANHVFFGSRPIVGLASSTFYRYRAIGRYLTPLIRLRSWDQAAIAADIAFSRQPAEAPEVMIRAARALDLDVLAIDYATRADGSVVLWEANPYFALDSWQQGVLPRHRRLEERITGFAAAYADFLEELLELPVPAGR